MLTQTYTLDFDELQRDQQAHDVRAHQDILALQLPKRLTHFTLHFAKYQGAIAGAIKRDDKSKFCRALTDSLIIVLASANAMNISLYERVQESESNGRRWCAQKNVSRNELLLGYVEIVASMAKACEALDHRENFPSRSIWEQSIIELLPIIILLAQYDQLDLEVSVSERWAQVEHKFRFRGQVQSEEKIGSISV